jgi:hypothetical protein
VPQEKFQQAFGLSWNDALEKVFPSIVKAPLTSCYQLVIA